jgi:hypothetical protein
MKLCIVIASSLLAIGLVSGATATSLGTKQLNVRQVEDFPVGCLPEDGGENIELKSAFVIEASDAIRAPPQGWALPRRRWAVELIPGERPLILRPGECIAFGKSIDGYRKIGEFHPLEEGKTYVFGLRRGDRLNEWVSDSYRGLFCVQRLSDGRLAYLPYIRHPNGTITYPPCGRYAGLPPAPDGISPPRPASSFPIDTSSP